MRLLLEDRQLTLQSTINAQIIAILPRMEGYRRWLGNGHLRCENTRHNLDILKTLPGLVVYRPEELPEAPMEKPAEKPANGTPIDLEHAYKSPTEPYRHQDDAMRKILSVGNQFALFAEQGTGKTKILIDWCGRLFLEDRITGVLVVSKRGPHRQWAESELPKHCGIGWAAGWWPFRKMDQNLLRRHPRLQLKWLCVNYDGIKTARGKVATLEFCRAHRNRLMIIADESHQIKNQRSARFKAMMRLSEYSSHRALATGTPIAKDLTDEWAQMKWLNEDILGIRYVTAFRAEYCIMGGFQGRSVIGHRNVQRFKKKVDPYSFRATKDDLGILPKQYGEWVFDLTDYQKALQRELKQEFKAQLESGNLVQIADSVTFMGKFQQIASGFLITDTGKPEEIMGISENPRLAAMVDWLDTFEGKAIVWARFQHDFRLIARMLDHTGTSHATYYGATSEKDRVEAVRGFLDPAGFRVLVANPSTAGTGLNLQGSCNNVLYYSNSFNAIDRWQSEDRVHRIGTVGAVKYVDLIGKGSPDRAIMRNLRNKKSISDMALGDIRAMVLDTPSEAGDTNRLIGTALQDALDIFG